MINAAKHKSTKTSYPPVQVFLNRINLKKEEIVDIKPKNWWESKRLLYNLALIVGAFFAYLITCTSSREFSLVDSIIWFFGANLFYTMSWVFELLFYKFYGKYPFNRTSRKTIIVLGTLFSIWWTCLGLQ